VQLLAFQEEPSSTFFRFADRCL